ncbi:MAG: hypothetical protein Q8M00_01900 [bacterium]|nr:hypothetical protein [bacterium]
MADKDFSEMNSRLRQEVEEILSQDRASQLTFEMLEIHDKVVAGLRKTRIRDIESKMGRPLKDTLLAWEAVLKECGAEVNKDILLGIILATIYERTKSNQKGGKG